MHTSPDALAKTFFFVIVASAAWGEDTSQNCAQMCFRSLPLPALHENFASSGVGYESALLRPGSYFILPAAMAPHSAPAASRSGKASERQWPRFKVDFAVKLLIGSHGTKSSVPGRAHDLGQGGVALYAVAELDEGQQLQIEFTPPFSRRPLVLTAIVRDRAGYRYGLEFRKLTRDASDDLSRACRALSLSTE